MIKTLADPGGFIGFHETPFSQILNSLAIFKHCFVTCNQLRAIITMKCKQLSL